MILDEIAHALGGKRSSDGNWMCRCPAHDDKTPSLSLTEKDGKILWKCFAGCSQQAVKDALDARQLLEPGPATNGHRIATPKSEWRTFEYRNEFNDVQYTKRKEVQKPVGRKRIYSFQNPKTGKSERGCEALLYNLPAVLDAREEGRTIVVTEGEDDVNTFSRLGFVATTSDGGANSWLPRYGEILKGCNVIFCGDNDVAGEKYREAVLKSLDKEPLIVKVPAPFKDITDWFNAGNQSQEKFNLLIASAKEELSRGKLKTIDLADFLRANIQPREMILAPWLTVQSLNMVHAYRGTGKTFFCLEVALAAALGRPSIGRWEALKPRRVLYVDGEMAPADLQQRVQTLISTPPEPGYFTLLGPYQQTKSMPDLSDQESRAELTGIIKDTRAELVILDNLSCLIRGEHAENEAEWWNPVQPWAIGLRNSGVAVLFVHHSGKSLKQRGTSKKEDIMDCVLTLERPHEAQADSGAVFNIKFEKNRALHGRDVATFEAKLEEINGQNVWTTKTLEQSTRDRVKELFNEGFKPSEIAEQLGIGKPLVSYHLKKLAQTIDDEEF